MSGSLISSVQVQTLGAHEHVRIWVRGQYVGTLIMGPGDGEQLRQAFADPAWLVKDFSVLYRAAEAEAAQAHLDGYDTAHLRDLARQLERLKPAFAECDALRETARLLSVERNGEGG